MKKWTKSHANVVAFTDTHILCLWLPNHHLDLYVTTETCAQVYNKPNRIFIWINNKSLRHYDINVLLPYILHLCASILPFMSLKLLWSMNFYISRFWSYLLTINNYMDLSKNQWLIKMNSINFQRSGSLQKNIHFNKFIWRQ